MNTKLMYMYRDASNYKQFEEVVFFGEHTPEDLALIQSKLNDGEWFVPHQVGLEDLQKRFGGSQYDDDHPWHELHLEDPHNMDIEATDEEPTEVMTWAEFMALWRNVTEWEQVIDWG